MDNKRGFTIVEVLVSIAISGMLIVVISSFLLTHVKNNQKLGNLNELQYQAQIVNDYLVTGISQSKDIIINKKYDMITLTTYSSENEVWSYKLKRIMRKKNGDIFEEKTELAVYCDSMDFSVKNNLIHYKIIFAKGNELYLLENSVLMRNAIN